jgi:hypothetical protein
MIMYTPTAYFQPDNRAIVIVENYSNTQEAEKQADEFLEGIAAQDEAGAHYQRVQVSGIEREGKYYFDVVVVY